MYFKIGDASELSSGRVYVLCSVSYPYAVDLIHKYFSLAHSMFLSRGTVPQFTPVPVSLITILLS
ncbi:hypothetical protein BGW80DRAFT_1367205 [Lactifluus volemus]|nr:hypothetical protein BGW80DRAFT_1367205 [Lactifluus volemus]